MKTVIEMAREAGFATSWTEAAGQALERFAELARADAIADEREACAKVCEALGVHPALNVYGGGPEWYKHGKDCAAAIRARGQS